MCADRTAVHANGSESQGVVAHDGAAESYVVLEGHFCVRFQLTDMPEVHFKLARQTLMWRARRAWVGEQSEVDDVVDRGFMQQIDELQHS